MNHLVPHVEDRLRCEASRDRHDLPSELGGCRLKGWTKIAHCGAPQTTKSIVLFFGIGLVIGALTGIFVGRISRAFNSATAFGIAVHGIARIAARLTYGTYKRHRRKHGARHEATLRQQYLPRWLVTQFPLLSICGSCSNVTLSKRFGYLIANKLLSVHRGASDLAHHQLTSPRSEFIRNLTSVDTPVKWWKY